MASGQPQISATASAQPGDILLVVHDFQARSPDELSLIRGELIELIERDDDFGDGWYLGKHLQDGRTGLFPEVYTKLAPASVTAMHRPLIMCPPASAAINAQSSLATSTGVNGAPPPANRLSDATIASPSQVDSQNHYDTNAPAPLNTSGTTQRTATHRAMTAPLSGSQLSPSIGGPVTQRSMSVVMDKTRDNGEDSPVITETLGVINEHMTEMSTPRSSILAFPRPKGNDSGSEYSSHVDHRLSYINGNETDEEDNLTLEEVMAWTPAQAALYLHEIGVEQRHCDVFQEQEISGEVLLNLEKSELFMPELELGPIGRRLATWHKIKAFQEEIKSGKEGPTPSVTGSIPSAAGSSFTRNGDSSLRSSGYRYPQQSPMIPEHDTQGVSGLHTPDSMTRPSAAAVRDYQHSRRHSSLDYKKPDRGTPPISPSTQIPGHKQQGSFDKNWTMNTGYANQVGAKGARATSMLPETSPGMTRSGSPPVDGRRVMTTNTADLARTTSNTTELDRGYLSSGEAETVSRGSKLRNLLRKSQPNSAAHSRQNSGNADTRSILSNGTTGTKRHSRFGSAGSIFGTLNSQLSTHPTLGHQDKMPSPRLSRSDSKALSKGENSGPRGRSISLRETSSIAPSGSMTLAGSRISAAPPSAPLTAPLPLYSPPATETIDTTPVVTKLDYSESPTSITSKSNPTTPLMKSDGFSAIGRMTNSFRTGKRSSSDAVTNVEKSRISAPVVPTVVEAPLQSPARTGSTTPSAASKSMEMDTTPDQSVKGAGRTVSGGTTSKKTKNKKDTSAYRYLQATTPMQASADSAHSGWMHKKSAKMTSTFKSRYFVLKDKRLSYFYSLDDTVEKGLIDINSHRVEQVEHDIMTTLYATLAGAGSGPTSPAVLSTAPGSTPNSGTHPGGPFFFKLVPPRSGLSKAVQFTRPTVHYFAVDNYEEGREWFTALKKATIDLDDSQGVKTTYNQKTISLSKAQQQRQRPPALMNSEDLPESKSEQDQDLPPNAENEAGGLAIGGLNLSYEHILPNIENSSANGIPEVNVISEPAETPDATTTVPSEVKVIVESEPDADVKRPQSEQPSGTNYAEEKSGSTLRLVRSLSGGMSRQSERSADTGPAA